MIDYQEVYYGSFVRVELTANLSEYVISQFKNLLTNSQNKHLLPNFIDNKSRNGAYMAMV